MQTTYPVGDDALVAGAVVAFDVPTDREPLLFVRSHIGAPRTRARERAGQQNRVEHGISRGLRRGATQAPSTTTLHSYGLYDVLAADRGHEV
jgi:hypothetical protein